MVRGDEYEFIVRGNQHLIELALINLIDNAIKYSNDDVEVELDGNYRKVMILIKDRGIGNFRGKIKVIKGAKEAVGYMRCDSLLLSDEARSETIPQMYTEEGGVELNHEASTGRIEEDKLFYLRSRGFDEDEAISLLVNGFFDPIVRHIPFEYAIEIRKLIDMSIKGL